MKLSDIMSAMHLEVYAEVALLIFLSVFVLVLAQVLTNKGKTQEWQRARLLPLEEPEPSGHRKLHTETTGRVES